MPITVTDVLPVERYNTVSAQVEYSIPFKFFNSADILVYYDDETTAADTGTYTVSGAGDDDAGNRYVTFDSAPFEAGYERVTILRASEKIRHTIFGNVGQNWTADNVNEEYDNIILLLQEEYEKSTRALLAPFTDELEEGDLFLPAIAARKGKVLGFDSGGKPQVVSPSFDPVSGATAHYTMEFTDGPSGSGISGSNLESVLGVTLATGDTVLTGKYDSNKTAGSGALFQFTGATTVGKAGNAPDADGYFYDAVGRQFENVSSSHHVAQWGAVSDGVNNDTSSVHAAIAYLGVNGGGTLHFPVGTTTNDTTITNIHGIQFIGASQNSCAWRHDDLTTPMFKFTNSNDGSQCFFDQMIISGKDKDTRTAGAGWVEITANTYHFNIGRIRLTQWNDKVFWVNGGSLYSSSWDTLRFASGGYFGRAMYIEGGGICNRIGNLYTGSQDQVVAMYVGVAGFGCIIDVFNLGGNSGAALEHRDTGNGYIHIGTMNFEPNYVGAGAIDWVILTRNSFFSIGHFRHSGSSTPAHFFSITTNSTGILQSIGKVSGADAATSNIIDLVGQPGDGSLITYEGPASHVDNTVGSTQRRVYSIADKRFVDTSRSSEYAPSDRGTVSITADDVTGKSRRWLAFESSDNSISSSNNLFNIIIPVSTNSRYGFSATLRFTMTVTSRESDPRNMVAVATFTIPFVRIGPNNATIIGTTRMVDMVEDKNITSSGWVDTLDASQITASVTAGSASEDQTITVNYATTVGANVDTSGINIVGEVIIASSPQLGDFVELE